MAYIRSQKHAPSRQPGAHLPTAAALLALAAWPASGLAQSPVVSAETALPTVRVNSKHDSGYKAEAVSSPKFTEPLLDTPQTITVIRKEVLAEQAATSLTEALRNTPGVTLLLGEGGNSNTKDNIFLRGFDTSGSVFIDGVRDLGNFTRDTFNIEQIEVLKGPSGSEFGRGAPSGSINLSSKQPRAENFSEGSLSLGTADQQRVSADLNRQLGEHSAVRLNLMVQDRGMPGRDHVEHKGWAFAPSIAFGLGTPTRTTLSYLHVAQDNRPDGGVPTVGLPGYFNAALSAAGVVPPRSVDRSNYYGAASDFEKVEADMLTARLEHRLTPDTTLTNTFRAGRARHRLVLTGPSGVVSDDPDGNNGPLPAVARLDPETWTATRSRHTKWQENTILTNQTNVASTFRTGSVKHALSAGFEFIYEKQLSRGVSGAGTMAPANLWHPDIHDALTGRELGFSGARTQGDVLTLGLYAFDTIDLNDRVQINAGVRLDKYKVDNDILAAPAGTPPTQAGSSLTASGTLVSWKLGALYKPAPHGSVYLSYATSQQPPGGSNFTLNATATNINHPNLDPQKASNLELGTKWELFDNRLALTGAIFRSDNRNDLTQADPVTGDITQYGKKLVQGIELGVVGQITPVWSLSAGLAKLDTEVRRGTSTQTGASLNWSPELSFTAWTTYKLPFGVTIGGGARYMDSVVRSISNTAQAASTNMLNVPSYWVFDAMAQYEVNRNVTLQLNVYNLADKFYIASLNNNGNRYIPGASRSAMLTANVKF